MSNYLTPEEQAQVSESRRKRIMEEIREDAKKREKQGTIIKVTCYIIFGILALFNVLPNIIGGYIKQKNHEILSNRIQSPSSNPLSAIYDKTGNLSKSHTDISKFKYFGNISNKDAEIFLDKKDNFIKIIPFRQTVNSSAKSDFFLQFTSKDKLKSKFNEPIDMLKNAHDEFKTVYNQDIEFEKKAKNLEKLDYELACLNTIVCCASLSKSLPKDHRPYLIAGFSYYEYASYAYITDQNCEAIIKYMEQKVMEAERILLSTKSRSLHFNFNLEDESDYPSRRKNNNRLLNNENSFLDQKHSELINTYKKSRKDIENHINTIKEQTNDSWLCATKELENAIKLDNSSHITHYYLSGCYYYNDDYDKAIQEIKICKNLLSEQSKKPGASQAELSEFNKICDEALKIVENQKNLDYKRPYKTFQFKINQENIEKIEIETKLNYPEYLKTSQFSLMAESSK